MVNLWFTLSLQEACFRFNSNMPKDDALAAAFWMTLFNFNGKKSCIFFFFLVTVDWSFGSIILDILTWFFDLLSPSTGTP